MPHDKIEPVFTQSQIAERLGAEEYVKPVGAELIVDGKIVPRRSIFRNSTLTEEERVKHIDMILDQFRK